MRDLEVGKLPRKSPRSRHGRVRAWWPLAVSSRHLTFLAMLAVVAGLAWLLEAHTLLWYTMRCEYLSHRDARFVDRANNYLCLSDVELADVLRGLVAVTAAAFEAHNVTYFLESGTLLGAFREHGVIRHDSDVDLAIDARGLAYLQYHEVELPDGYVLNVWNSPLFPGSTRDDKLPVRITHTPTALYADVFAFLDWEGDATPWDGPAVGPLPSVCFKGCQACPFVGEYRHFTVPRDWVYPLVDCDMDGRTYKCPRESAKYLAHMYGENYMIPS